MHVPRLRETIRIRLQNKHMRRVPKKIQRKRNGGRKKMWSCYDEQTNRYMATGLNSKTLKECVECVWDWWEMANDEFTEKEVEKIAKNKKDWLEGLELRFEEHTDKKMEE